jgi:ribosomal-protein-alanine N-acetyltransferase
MKLCEYTSENGKDCLAIFDSNTPVSFAVQERETFQAFLNRLAYPYFYFVVQDDREKIVACGGIKLELSSKLAWLRWDMVAREFHHRKIGTFLALSRLYLICQIPDIQTANLHTSQHSYQFYEKIGFVVQHIVPDGIVPGMDEYSMQLKLDKSKSQEIKSFSKRESLGGMSLRDR